MVEAIEVTFGNETLGALSYDSERRLGAFEYEPAFRERGLEVSPLHMPLSDRIYTFPALDPAAFKGLPGLVADSLPDDFGNAVLNAWIARQGKTPADITPLQRLQYTGERGMGALGFHPATRIHGLGSDQVAIDALVKIAQDILDQRQAPALTLNGVGAEDQEAMLALLSVGMSAGGARAKAVLAFNEDFTEVRSGQARIPPGFTHYLLKFDGVTEHRSDRETFGDPLGYSAMEYVYSLMARTCGIDMMPCRLLPEGRRRHFLTQRFDRIGNHRIHMQTLNGLAHVSYKQPGSYSYEELFGVARQLRLGADAAGQLFRRMVFNVMARNHDDHAKNFAFVMDDQGRWSLAPTYDLAYSYKPGSPWVDCHWMLLNGKRDHFTRADFHAFEKLSPLFTRRWVDHVLDDVAAAVARWPALAREYEVPDALAALITSNLRLNW
ncbi:MAG TPA: type II toxin-antitoxin system HipA family toxin [Hyphomicrobiales bacterium]|nr:type II toxin-antitoxin system HipA family toxin [Hyphomicrobiales bacterium]